jgi:hypothetical protein
MMIPRKLTLCCQQQSKKKWMTQKKKKEGTAQLVAFEASGGAKGCWLP